MDGRKQIKGRFLTTREASHLLRISEKDIIELADKGEIPCYSVAGEFLRFRKDEILNVRENLQKKFNLKRDPLSAGDKIKDFFYFNDFYIVSGGIILALLWLIFKP